MHSHCWAAPTALIQPAPRAAGLACPCHTTERFVAPVGITSTAASFGRVCPPGAVITAVKGASSAAAVTAFGGFACTGPTATTSLDAVGAGKATSTFSDSSAKGYTSVAVGFSATAVMRITLFKADGSSKLFGSTANPPSTATASCPTGTKVVGFHGRASTTAPATVGLYCR